MVDVRTKPCMFQHATYVHKITGLMPFISKMVILVCCLFPIAFLLSSVLYCVVCCHILCLLRAKLIEYVLYKLLFSQNYKVLHVTFSKRCIMGVSEIPPYSLKSSRGSRGLFEGSEGPRGGRWSLDRVRVSPEGGHWLLRMFESPQRKVNRLLRGLESPQRGRGPYSIICILLRYPRPFVSLSIGARTSWSNGWSMLTNWSSGAFAARSESCWQ